MSACGKPIPSKHGTGFTNDRGCDMICVKARCVSMMAYEGKEPYIFVSYSHKDADAVLALIAALKQKMCRVWYDEGLAPGESWNDSIADHLAGCEQFVVILTPDSVASKYVLSEINYALTKNKRVLPVLLKNTILPSGLEMMLSSVQFLDVTGGGDIKTAADAVAATLVKSVFATACMPFLQDLGYSFYMNTQDVEKQDTAKKAAATILARDGAGNELALFSLHRLGAYDVAYCISSVEPIKDYFYSGAIRGAYQINVVGHYCLEYPLDGPDVSALLVFILRIPRHAPPVLRLVDYQYVKSTDDDLDVLGEKGWSRNLQIYLEKMLNG